MPKKHIPMDKDALIQEYEELKDDPFYQPSSEAKKKFERLVNNYFFKQRLKRIFYKSNSGLNKMAISFAFIITLFLISVFTVEAVKVKVLNFFMNIQEEYTEVGIDHNSPGNNSGSNLQVDWDNAYIPTEIPKGYAIKKLTNNKNVKIVEYENESQSFIQFQQRSEDSGMNVDTEDADKIETINVQGHSGMEQ